MPLRTYPALRWERDAGEEKELCGDLEGLEPSGPPFVCS